MHLAACERGTGFCQKRGPLLRKLSLERVHVIGGLRDGGGGGEQRQADQGDTHGWVMVAVLMCIAIPRGVISD